jgi:hypothetical protein
MANVNDPNYDDGLGGDWLDAYSTSGSSSDGSSFNFDSIFNALPGTLSGIAGIIGASQGHTPVTYVNGVPQYPYQTQPPVANNQGLYIGLAVGALILVLLFVFLLKK